MDIAEIADYIVNHALEVIADDTAFQALPWDSMTLIATMEAAGYVRSCVVKLFTDDGEARTSALSGGSIIPVLKELSVQMADDADGDAWRVCTLSVRKADGAHVARFFFGADADQWDLQLSESTETAERARPIFD